MNRPFNPNFDPGMKGFYPWDVADLNFPAALEDESVLSNTLISTNYAAQNGQVTTRDADEMENPQESPKLSYI
jgi:hypothetical protein